MYHRPTLTKKAAVKFLPYFELLLDQLVERKLEGMFLSTAEFGGIGVHTLQVRFSDALLWLTRHNIDDKIDKRADYLHLKNSIKNKREQGGLRIYMMMGPRPDSTLRTNTVDVSTWKSELEEFLSDDSRTAFVKENIVLTSEELEYVQRIVGNICGKSGEVKVIGDKLVVVRG